MEAAISKNNHGDVSAFSLYYPLEYLNEGLPYCTDVKYFS